MSAKPKKAIKSLLRCQVDDDGVVDEVVVSNWLHLEATSKEILGATLKQMPFPNVGWQEFADLERAVEAYFSVVKRQPRIPSQKQSKGARKTHSPSGAEQQDLFTKSDAEAKIEPPPQNFNDLCRLNDLLAITADWHIHDARKAELVERKVSKLATDEELQELDGLKRLTSARRSLYAPLPLNELAKVKADLIRKGRWLDE